MVWMGKSDPHLAGMNRCALYARCAPDHQYASVHVALTMFLRSKAPKCSKIASVDL